MWVTLEKPAIWEWLESHLFMVVIWVFGGWFMTLEKPRFMVMYHGISIPTRLKKHGIIPIVGIR